MGELQVLNVEYVDLVGRFILVNTGSGDQLLPITGLFDEEGDETDDPAVATACIAGTDEFGWVSVAACACGCKNPVVH